jgi:DNA-binding HxlR family transcriptional regulator
MRRQRRKSDCPIHFALEAFGDSWTLLIVRDLMFKARSTYTDFLQAEEGIATNILADRLARLERDGIVWKERNQYRLTSKGVDLLPLLLEVIAWSAKYDRETAAPGDFVRRLHTDKEALEREIRMTLQQEGHGRPSSVTGDQPSGTRGRAGARQPQRFRRSSRLEVPS